MFILFICALILFYYYCKRNHDYWKIRNVKYKEPLPLFGNNFGNFFGRYSWAESSIEFYNKYPKEKVVGYYRGSKPELIIRDPELVRHILNVDFNYFYARGLGRDPALEPLFLNLFHIDGDRWKLLRQRLTPAFTSSKLKAMFPLIVNCAKKLQVLTSDIAATKDEYDVRELMARFTTEFIGACGFGIEMDTLNDEQSLFRELGRTIFVHTNKNLLLIALKDLFPRLMKPVKPMNPLIESTITEILKNIREQRNYKPSGRNDFVDLLLELECRGKISVESIEKRNADGSPVMVEMEMDVQMQAAQLFIFFAAGFETSSSVTSYTLHLLAYHQEIQTKIHKEIDEVLSKYNNTLSYEAIKEMNLLDRSLKESMRIFPSVGVLNRDCVKKYTIPDTNITIDPGVKIVIPVMAMQNDEKYFYNPKEFDPDRFLDENVKNINKYVYMPFGEGPRSCIGERLGRMQSLAGLAAILQKFRVEPSKSSVQHPKVLATSNVVQSIKHGLPLRIVKRDDAL